MKKLAILTLCAALVLGFAGLALLPLPEVTALRFVTPILIVIFAALILGERIIEFTPLAYETVFQNMQDPVIVVDDEERVIGLNRGADLVTGHAFNIVHRSLARSDLFINAAEQACCWHPNLFEQLAPARGTGGQQQFS